MLTQATHRKIVRSIWGELLPFPGRLSGSLRDTLGITIALVLTMTLRVPGIPSALALLFLLQRERPGLSLRSGFHIFSGAALALLYALVCVQATDGSAAGRVLGLVLLIFVAAFGMSASTVPLVFTLFGFYGFLDLSLWDGHRSADAIVRSILYNLASLAIVLLSAIAVEYVFGSRHPADELQMGLNKRLQALSRLFHSLASGANPSQAADSRVYRAAVVQYAHAGDRHLNKLYNLIHDSETDPASVPIGLRYRIGLLTRVLEKSTLISLDPEHTPQAKASFTALAQQCVRLLTDLPSGSTGLPVNAPALAREIHTELVQYATAEIHEPGESLISFAQSSELASLVTRFFLPDAFVTTDSSIFALKLTLAATLCYVFYNAIAWPGILTCVVTVLFTGLSSTGAMKQKQLYRFAGAAIGGALGIATVSLLFPNMDSITSLVVVVGAVAILSAWVLRSPSIGYIGVQIGFAFFLTALPGFGAATLIAPARDRVIGIAVGILAMWFIFDQIWPVRSSAALHQALERIQKSTARLEHASRAESSSQTLHVLTTLRAAVSFELVATQQLESAARFEFGRGHKRELASTRRLVRQIESAAAAFYTQAKQLREISLGHPP